MIEIDGKQYELVEISARKYQALINRMEKEFGDNWQAKGGAQIAVIMLGSSLKAEDGTFPTEDALWELPMRILNKLSAEATKLNGLSAESQAELEKN